MGDTKIEYLDKSWSPISMKCTPISNGCTRCWHLRMCNRLAKNPSIYWADQRAYAGGPFRLNEKRLEAPLHWRKQARVAVQFMGDLFHREVPDDFIFKVFGVMGGAVQHTYFLLTKRPERIAGVFRRINPFLKAEGRAGLGSPWSHVWLGCTVCNQAEADAKIPILLGIPGFKKWISIEPMLGPIDLTGGTYGPNFLEGWDVEECPIANGDVFTKKINIDKISFVVAGSETGPGARPADPSWFRSLRDQCQAAGVPFFLKRLSVGYGWRTLDGRGWNELPT